MKAAFEGVVNWIPAVWRAKPANRRRTHQRASRKGTVVKLRGAQFSSARISGAQAGDFAAIHHRQNRGGQGKSQGQEHEHRGISEGALHNDEGRTPNQRAECEEQVGFEILRQLTMACHSGQQAFAFQRAAESMPAMPSSASSTRRSPNSLPAGS